MPPKTPTHAPYNAPQTMITRICVPSRRGTQMVVWAKAVKGPSERSDCSMEMRSAGMTHLTSSVMARQTSAKKFASRTRNHVNGDPG